jgi:hypothetical protein
MLCDVDRIGRPSPRNLDLRRADQASPARARGAPRSSARATRRAMFESLGRDAGSFHSVTSAQESTSRETVPVATAACHGRRHSWATGFVSSGPPRRVAASRRRASHIRGRRGCCGDRSSSGQRVPRGLVNRKCGKGYFLLLGRLEVGVGTGGVVGDVDDVVDFGHRLGDGHFDALAEGDCGHAAALAASS